jgi:hypothetical protein
MAAILPFLPGLFTKHLDVRTLSVLVSGHSQEWESLDLVIRNIMGFCSEIYNNCKKHTCFAVAILSGLCS